MNDKLVTVKAAVAACFTAMGAFLGWQGVMAVIWIAAMVLDYLSGSLAAWLSGEWSSAVAREGLKHKAGMLLVVAVACITDMTLVIICEHLPVQIEWPVLVFPMVLAWYILTELGSILENAVKMGAPLPKWLMNILRAGLKIIDNKGKGIQEEITDTEEADIDASE